MMSGPLFSVSDRKVDRETITITQHFAEFERAKGLAERTISNRHYMLLALSDGAQKPLQEITIHDLRSHLARGIGRGSMQTERDCYRAFYRFLREEEFRADDPTERLAKIRAPRGRPRPFTEAQIDAMLSSGAYKHTRVMILLAAYQGFRASEVAAVHGRDIDLESDIIRVVGKGNKYAELPLHPMIREVAETMPRDSWWFPARKREGEHIHSRSVSDLMTRAKRRAGIESQRLTGHSLRHAYGTDLLRSGVDVRIVQELMRHESLATTQIYTLVNEKQTRDGILRLPSKVLQKQSGRGSRLRTAA
jgi:integrase/recombinase XerD